MTHRPGAVGAALTKLADPLARPRAVLVISTSAPRHPPK